MTDPVSRTGATDREVEADRAELFARLYPINRLSGRTWRDLDPLGLGMLDSVRELLVAARAAPAPDSGQREDGAALVAAERARQVEQEGWTPEHDAEHAGESLALAACCYAVPPQMRKYRAMAPGGPATVPTLWPWGPLDWKPCPDDRVRELVKAGALIAAEIDRLQAAALLAEQPGGDHRG